MRPLEKWTAGTVTTLDGARFTIPATFVDYHDAKPILCNNFGRCCSYCETAYNEERDLAVEHIQPKRYKAAAGRYVYAHLENEWSNFLISCDTCNGADNKDTKDVAYGQCHLPHLNNTYLSLCYHAGGVVTVNPSLTGQSQQNAARLLSLVGLDKSPATSSKGDTRWPTRRRNWDLANRYLAKYLAGKTDVDTIIDLVEGRGGWSIWFTVFSGHDDVRRALVNRFPGTASNCFDAVNHYEPIPRNPHNTIDPV